MICFIGDDMVGEYGESFSDSWLRSSENRVKRWWFTSYLRCLLHQMLKADNMANEWIKEG